MGKVIREFNERIQTATCTERRSSSSRRRRSTRRRIHQIGSSVVFCGDDGEADVDGDREENGDEDEEEEVTYGI
jgi:hypothetical protein